jgi:hypothetical protein
MLKYNIILIGYLIMFSVSRPFNVRQQEGSSSSLTVVPSQHLPGDTVENHEKLSQNSRVLGEIQTEVLHTVLEHYQHNKGHAVA